MMVIKLCHTLHMLHIMQDPKIIPLISIVSFSLQFGGFLVHCLNALCILLRNDLALHLQSGCQCVGEGAEVFGEDCKFLRKKEGREGVQSHYLL